MLIEQLILTVVNNCTKVAINSYNLQEKTSFCHLNDTKRLFIAHLFIPYQNKAGPKSGACLY